MKRKSRYEPLETDISKILTPSGNHEKATTTTVTYDLVFDKLKFWVFTWTLKTIIRSIWFNTKIWSYNKTNSERQFDNRFFTSRANSSSWLSSTGLFTMRYRFTRVKLYRRSSKQFEKSRMKHFWIKFYNIFLQDSAFMAKKILRHFFKLGSVNFCKSSLIHTFPVSFFIFSLKISIS